MRTVPAGAESEDDTLECVLDSSEDDDVFDKC